MELKGVNFDDTEIRAFCRRHGITRLALFGSILGDAFGPTSDVDMLVEFESRRNVSLFDLGGMVMEMRDLIGREVDLRTPLDLSRYFREDVLRKARVLYAA